MGAGTVAAFLPAPDDTPPPAPLALTSELVEGATEALTVSAPPSTYRVVYRVDTIGDGATTTEEFTVERPFDSRIAAYQGEPPGGDLLWEATSNLGLYSTATSEDEAAAQVAQLAPATALGDFRLDATLADLVASGTFVAHEQRQLLGRTCQVYRTGSALETPADLGAVRADLHRRLHRRSRAAAGEDERHRRLLVSRMIAISVDDARRDRGGHPRRRGDPLPVDQGGSQLVPSRRGHPRGRVLGVGDAAGGYEHVGRYLLRDPDTRRRMPTRTKRRDDDVGRLTGDHSELSRRVRSGMTPSSSA